jgi:hypothetical protein
MWLADCALNSMDSTCFESETNSMISRCVVSMCHQLSMDLKHMSMIDRSIDGRLMLV